MQCSHLLHCRLEAAAGNKRRISSLPCLPHTLLVHGRESCEHERRVDWVPSEVLALLPRLPSS